MQDSLNACATFRGKSVEVVNFGVDGYGTAQELLTLEHYAWAYDPDVVLLAFFAGNDIRTTPRCLSPTKCGPFSTFGMADWSWILLSSIRRNSTVGRAKYSVHSGIAGCPTIPGRINYWDSVTPVTDDWSNAWLITEALIERMRDEVQAKGARFLVVSLTIGIQVDPDSAVRSEYARSLGVPDLEYPERRLRSLGQRESIEVLTLAPMLLSYAEKNNEILHGFFRDHRRSTGHYNKARTPCRRGNYR